MYVPFGTDVVSHTRIGSVTFRFSAPESYGEFLEAHRGLAAYRAGGEFDATEGNFFGIDVEVVQVERLPRGPGGKYEDFISLVDS